MNDREFQSISAFKEVSGLTDYELRKRIRAGRLPYLRVGAKYMIDATAALEQLHDEAVSNVAGDKA